MFIKKIDKLVLTPFIGLFMLTVSVTIFVLLMHFFLIWFDELIGKDLGWKVYMQFFFYFGVALSPSAFPIATLVASLISFGNLGESLELTALKSAGTSLLRILCPLILLASLLSVVVFFSNNYLVPKVTVKAYSLLHDLRRKKPSVAIKEGVFFNGIPDYSIRVEKKLPDEKTLLDVIIYDHTKDKGNVAMTTAAYGQLYTMDNDRYLVVELFNGHNYLEGDMNEGNEKKDPSKVPGFYRTTFKSQKLLLDMDEFKLNRTSTNLFSYHQTTKNAKQLQADIDRFKAEINTAKQILNEDFKQHWPFAAADDVTVLPESVPAPQSSADTEAALKQQHSNLPHVYLASHMPCQSAISPHWLSNFRIINCSAIASDASVKPKRSVAVIQKALKQAKDYKEKLSKQIQTIDRETKKLKQYTIEQQKRLSSAVGCILMLLIGATLGALIKKGGLGVPLLIATCFILLYYIADIMGVRWAKAGFIPVFTGAWAANLILLPFGAFFLRQAQKDSRILDKDAYAIFFDQMKSWFRRKR